MCLATSDWYADRRAVVSEHTVPPYSTYWLWVQREYDQCSEFAVETAEFEYENQAAAESAGVFLLDEVRETLADYHVEYPDQPEVESRRGAWQQGVWALSAHEWNLQFALTTPLPLRELALRRREKSEDS